MNWALRHYALSALALACVVAIATVVAAPGLALAPQLAPLRDAAWGTGWSTLALGANVARDQALAALSGAVVAAGAAVLVVAALTVLSLSVARSVQRRSEIVVRRAVGASRRALGLAALTEGGVIAVVGLTAGAVGGVIAALLMRRGWPGTMGPVSAGPLLWILGLGVVVVLGALLPLGFARPRTPGGDATGRGVPLLVPAAQFALGLLGLLAGAQLARRVETSPAPSAAANGVIVPLSFANSTRTVPELLDSVLTRMRADSGLTLASLHSPGTLIGLGYVDIVTTECGRCFQGGIATPLRVVQATNHLASADTFRAMGLRVVEGRSLSDADRWGAAPVAVVNRYLAEREFEGGRAVGRQIRVGGPDNWYRVVGIVEDGQFNAIGAGATPRPRVFLSVLQHEARELELLVRGGRGIAATTTEHDMRQREARAAGWFARMLQYEGWAGLLLAALGMLAVMRLWVAGVLPELGLRRALGARRRHVVGRVAARALVVVGGGAALAWWLAPLAGVPAGEIWLVRGPLAALLVVTLGALVGPAWRAARAAPATLPGFTEL